MTGEAAELRITVNEFLLTIAEKTVVRYIQLASLRVTGAGRVDGCLSVTSIPYGVGDGMKSSETNGGNQPAGWKTADGRLWFPALKGVVAVDPNRINSLPPPNACSIEATRKRRVASGKKRCRSGLPTWRN